MELLINNKSEIYFDVELKTDVISFSSKYSSYHGWISSVICSIGIFLNILNVIILRRKNLTKCSVNSILISIAFCDSIIMIVYLPYCIHYYILNKNPIYSDLDSTRDTFMWTIYAVIVNLVSVTFHSISIWLTVYLSVYRYLHIKKSVYYLSKKKTNENKTKKKLFLLEQTKPTLFCIVIFCVLFCLPNYLYHQIRSSDQINNDTTTTITTKVPICYFIGQSDLNIASNDLIFTISFYSQAIIGKILPCCLLGIFISLIIYYLYMIQKNKNNVLNDNQVNIIIIITKYD
jgi:hypothetical protein